MHIQPISGARSKITPLMSGGGIEQGVIVITEAVVDAVTGVASITLMINEITTLAKLAIDGIEDAARFIGGLFQFVGAAIERLIDWLKALFDFAAIWRTKEAFQEILEQLPAYFTTLATSAQGKFDGWFTAQEQNINDAFAGFESTVAGKTIGTVVPMPPSGPWQGSNTAAAGSATFADFGSNPHPSWFTDKLKAYPPPASIVLEDDPLGDAWAAFLSVLDGAGADFLTALDGAAATFAQGLQSPASFGAVVFTSFLDLIKGLIDSALKLCDAAVEALLQLVIAAMPVLTAALNTVIDAGPLNAVWSWIAAAAGQPSDPLTWGALLSLLYGFPTTILYKLAVGVDQEPFPNGLPSMAIAAASLDEWPAGWRVVAGILQIILSIPVAVADMEGPACRVWLVDFILAAEGLIFFLWNGWAVGLGGAVALFLARVLGGVIASIRQRSNNSGYDSALRFVSLLGVGGLIVGIVNAVGNKSKIMIVADILLPLQDVFKFLNGTQYREETWPLGVLGFFDFASCLMGGGMLVWEATSAS